MLCRLCLVDSAIEIIEIFDADGIRLQISDIIAKHFWFSPSKDDPISDKICCSCWSKVDSFHQFYCFVEQAQKNLSNIVSHSTNTVDLNSLTLLPVTLSDLKTEKIYDDTPTDDKNNDDDWHIDDLSTMKYPVVVMDKDDPLIEDNIVIKQENIIESILDKNKEDNKKQTKITNEKISTRKNNQASKRLNKNYKDTFSNSEKDSDNDIKHDTTESSFDSETITSKKKVRKRGNYKKSLNQKQKQSKKKSNVTENSTELEKIDLEIKSKEEDELVAKFIQMDCDICGENLGTFLKLQSHFKREHKIKNGYVICCNKKIFKRVLLLDHINYHVNPDAFKCVHCSKRFKDSHILKYHIAYYHESDESKLLKCDQCDKKFVKQAMLDKHKLIHAPPEERHFTCEICNKSFPSQSHLTVHKTQVHEKQYHLVCDICAKKIPGKKLLEKHRLEHAGIVEPKAQCQKCGSWFKNEMLLKRHLKRHEEALMGLKCEICDKISPSKNALRSHIKYVHKKEKTFKCTFCEKAFKKEVVLKEHIMTHTGGALYMCPYCPKTFNSNANMHTHKKRTHPNEWEEERKQRLALAAAQSSVLPIQSDAAASITESN